MNEVRIPAFAKINVRLNVVGKRPDGFHELRTIFQTISLHDDLILRRAPGRAISLKVRGNAMLSSEPIEKNLVYRAVDLLRRELRWRDGVAIELQKPHWRVAVRRCLEFSRAQCWRAEPLLGFRTIRPSFARRFRETGMCAL